MVMGKKDLDPATEVPTDLLQYWATYPVGGSGMGVNTQNTLKFMAREILRHRGIEIDEGYHHRTTG